MSLDNLPVAWGTAEVGILCDLINGRAFKPSEWSETGLPIIRIQNLNNTRSKFNYFAGSLDDKHKVKKGDLLFAWSGTPGTSFGAHLWYGEDAALNQHIFKIVINEAHIDKSFFRYALNHKLDELILSAQGGVGLRHITKGTFEKTILNYPPLAEQQEIVRQLDLMLAQVEQIKARLDAIPAILKKFRQSVLADAVSGELTEAVNFQKEDFYDFVYELIKFNKKNKSIEVKEVSEYKSNWKDIPLSLLVDQDRGIPYGIVQTGDDTDGGINTIRCGDVLPFKVRSSNLKRVDKNIEKNYIRTRLQGGEVILAIRGSVGNAAVITSDLLSEPLNISREVAMIPVISKLDPHYLTIFLQSPSGKQVLIEQTRGVAQKGINLDDLRKLYIPLPTLEEQTLIVEKVNTLFSFSNHIEDVVEAAQKRVNLLTQSILAKAFSGELTAEWREQHQDLITDVNSAEALLAKIQAERIQDAKKTKRSITRKKKVVKDVIEPISVIQALTNSGKPLNSYDLFIAANYPSNSETELVEKFYLDLRSSIENGKVLEKSSADEKPYFELNI